MGWPDFSRVGTELAARADSVRSRVLEAIRAVAPVGQTEQLADTLDADVQATDSGFIVSVTSGVDYDRYVREGTSPHTIAAAHTTTTKRGTLRSGSLSFVASGGQVFVASVEHPGTQPNDYPAQADGTIGQIIADAVAEAVSAALGGG